MLQLEIDYLHYFRVLLGQLEILLIEIQLLVHELQFGEPGFLFDELVDFVGEVENLLGAEDLLVGVLVEVLEGQESDHVFDLFLQVQGNVFSVEVLDEVLGREGDGLLVLVQFDERNELQEVDFDQNVWVLIEEVHVLPLDDLHHSVEVVLQEVLQDQIFDFRSILVQLMRLFLQIRLFPESVRHLHESHVIEVFVDQLVLVLEGERLGGSQVVQPGFFGNDRLISDEIHL